MFDNHTYNLMRQLVEEHTSLWRIKNEYLKDSGDCAECKEAWTEFNKKKEELVSILQDLLKTHM